VGDSQLQKPALGLLGALQLKIGGLLPALFGGTIVPTIDVYDQYLAQGELKVVQNTVPISLVNTTSALRTTVPNGKAWRVLGVGGYWNFAAADVALIVQGSVWVVAPGINPGAELSCPVFTYNVPQLGQSTRSFGYQCPRPIFLPAGWGFFIDMVSSALPTVANTFTTTCFVQEFDL